MGECRGQPEKLARVMRHLLLSLYLCLLEDKTFVRVLISRGAVETAWNGTRRTRVPRARTIKARAQIICLPQDRNLALLVQNRLLLVFWPGFLGVVSCGVFVLFPFSCCVLRCSTAVTSSGTSPGVHYSWCCITAKALLAC